ncbi:MAG: Denitrification system component NirT [Betaproteobacteria bacterium]|nr:Denitrification system component NirT [Betaproteobacteria bacterium]
MSQDTPGFIRRCWTALRRPSAKWSMLVLLVVGFGGGIIFWGGFHTALEATNTMEFCISCHEMRDNVYGEYRETIHYTNRVGVRAICSDCHVPHEWGPKMVRKAKAALEIWGKLTGSIDTQEKFEAKRMTLASHEWERMKANGSQECRNCHSFDAMSGQIQKQSVYKKHMAAKDAGKTCIDCHKGIAHHLPKEYKDDDE